VLEDETWRVRPNRGDKLIAEDGQMIQGPLPDCPQCRELVKAADEAHRFAKQALLSKVQASGRMWALTSGSVGDADPTFGTSTTGA
jgi:hypothetical protein